LPLFENPRSPRPNLVHIKIIIRLKLLSRKDFYLFFYNGLDPQRSTVTANMWQAELWIRIQGFDDQKTEEKNYTAKILLKSFYDQKFQLTFAQVTEEAFSPKNYFSVFVRHFCPLGSGYGSRGTPLSPGSTAMVAAGWTDTVPRYSPARRRRSRVRIFVWKRRAA
jgi:hypothetical protein